MLIILPASHHATFEWILMDSWYGAKALLLFIDGACA